MKQEYIFAIVAGGIFLALLLIYLILHAVRQNKAKKFQAKLDEVYLDNNLSKMEYDFAVYDEETANFLSKMNMVAEKQVTIEDVLNDKSAQQDEVFTKIDAEGMEEITGNYQPKE